jgi:hypothetical protein
MATRQSPSSFAPQPVEIQGSGMWCWLFYRDNHALTCAISVDDDGEENGVHVTRLWDDESFSEYFKRPEDALRRHAEISSFLHESGWLLVERTVVPLAA